LTQDPWYLEATQDGGVYANLVERPTDLVRLSLRGDRIERIAGVPLTEESRLHIISGLPDGRGVVVSTAGGHARLMVAEKGKDLVPLIATAEETASPLTAVGPGEIAFVIGPMPQETIALADTASGRITRRITPGKGVINSLASSPDGKTLYFGANGSVWAIPPSGGEARMIRTGDSVTADPSGRGLIISRIETSRMRLFRVSPDGQSEQEIPMDNSISLMSIALSPNALSSDGHLLAPLSPRDSWFNHPVIIDTASGRITRIPSDNLSDYHSMAWLPDGRVLALQIGLRAKIWKFTPKRR
jgi:WD40 repeat protein